MGHRFVPDLEKENSIWYCNFRLPNLPQLATTLNQMLMIVIAFLTSSCGEWFCVHYREPVCKRAHTWIINVRVLIDFLSSATWLILGDFMSQVCKLNSFPVLLLLWLVLSVVSCNNWIFTIVFQNNCFLAHLVLLTRVRRKAISHLDVRPWSWTELAVISLGWEITKTEMNEI